MKYPADRIVHWPTRPVNVCRKHAIQSVSLGNVLGTHIAVTNLEAEHECLNCVNEATHAEMAALKRDADREMFGDEPEVFGLDDVGCK